MSAVVPGEKKSWGNGALWLCACITLFTAIVPFARAGFRYEVNYNEGWNIYNADIVAHHGLLYPVQYGWTTVNYPLLSFFLMAQLHRWTHEYLFTARAVSLLGLLGCSALVGAIVRSLGGSAKAALLAGLYCLAIFCADADLYVGADDPQIFAQVFFLLGFWIFLRDRKSLSGLSLAALAFALGVFLKHNPIDLPLAVLIELLLVSRQPVFKLRAAWFTACGLAFAGVGVWLNIRFGGPYFISQLLAPRVYVASKVPEQFINVFGPLLLPFLLALTTAWIVRKDSHLRIASILMATTLLVGGYFSGGQGVSINGLFSAMLATAILIGVFFDGVEKARWHWMERLSPTVVARIPVLLFGWLMIPMILSGNWNIAARLRESSAAEKRFNAEVTLLKSQPGPALCESLLLCYFAGKSYDYDPFNATRLIHFGKLDANLIRSNLQEHRYGAVQLDQPLSDPVKQERFDPSILATMHEQYAPTLTNEDSILYLPKAQ